MIGVSSSNRASLGTAAFCSPALGMAGCLVQYNLAKIAHVDRLSAGRAGIEMPSLVDNVAIGAFAFYPGTGPYNPSP
ncbi:exported hypothetical protein [Mesorhizobium sp. ORS 3359]|nr:exported hypothetical protein [Mesorhizobium sp. ORS 3359]